MTFDDQELKYIVYSKESGNLFTIGFPSLEEAEIYAQTVAHLIGIYKLEKVK